jgi:DNA ligase-1
MRLQTLYGRSKTDALKVWDIKTVGNVITVSHGMSGGKITEKSITILKGKNYGKKNATSPAEQARKEAQSKWDNKVKSGYSTDVESIPRPSKPMLAHDYLKNGHRIKYPAYVQPKLDGVRCLVSLDKVTNKIKFMSRGGNYFPPQEHLVTQLEPFFKDFPDHILDGELYIHDMFLQDIVSLVKKPKAGSEELEFVVFDLALEGIEWRSRGSVVTALGSIYATSHVWFLEGFNVGTEEEMKEYHDTFVGIDYEGAIVRNYTGLYEFDYRSADLQKYKCFKDAEFTIIEITEDLNGCGVLTCNSLRGTFEASLKASFEERKRLLDKRDDFIGKLATIKFFAYTRDGIPQFPVALSIRDYE